MSVKSTLKHNWVFGIVGVLLIFVLLFNSSITGELSFEKKLKKQVKAATEQTTQAVESVIRASAPEGAPSCCIDNRASIIRLLRDVEELKRRPATSTNTVIGGDAQSGQNSAHISRLIRDVDNLQERIISLERHVQDLEISESRTAQSSDTPQCSNVGAAAYQMNCQQACQVSNRRCTRAELVRIRLSDNQRQAPVADTCNAALRNNDNTYSYSFACRCCP